mmetsp:Transcript_30478/g.50451  ORF Transcript_30478/g.50451 Transcript_30478/m.50451 type:complete len:88 (-) Transcript_30478:24-287(-)
MYMIIFLVSWLQQHYVLVFFFYSLHCMSQQHTTTIITTTTKRRTSIHLVLFFCLQYLLLAGDNARLWRKNEETSSILGIKDPLLHYS